MNKFMIFVIFFLFIVEAKSSISGHKLPSVDPLHSFGVGRVHIATKRRPSRKAWLFHFPFTKNTPGRASASLFSFKKIGAYHVHVHARKKPSQRRVSVFRFPSKSKSVWSKQKITPSEALTKQGRDYGVYPQSSHKNASPDKDNKTDEKSATAQEPKSDEGENSLPVANERNETKQEETEANGQSNTTSTHEQTKTNNTSLSVVQKVFTEEDKDSEVSNKESTEVKGESTEDKKSDSLVNEEKETSTDDRDDKGSEDFQSTESDEAEAAAEDSTGEDDKAESDESKSQVSQSSDELKKEKIKESGDGESNETSGLRTSKSVEVNENGESKTSKVDVEEKDKDDLQSEDEEEEVDVEEASSSGLKLDSGDIFWIVVASTLTATIIIGLLAAHFRRRRRPQAIDLTLVDPYADDLVPEAEVPVHSPRVNVSIT